MNLTPYIVLDGKKNATLDWSEEKKQIEKKRDLGEKIALFLDLGLFADLQKPLEDAAQFLTLGLAIQHCLHEIWGPYKENILTISLFQGEFPFKEEENLFFATDRYAEFFDLLVAKISEDVPFSLNFSIKKELSLELEAKLLTKERFSRYDLALKGLKLPLATLSPKSNRWEEGKGVQEVCGKRLVIGILLPEEAKEQEEHPLLEALLKECMENKIDFKIIPENLLLEMWEGLEVLLVFPGTLSLQGKRKVLGFKAAQGTVLEIEECLSLPKILHKLRLGVD